MRSIIIVLLLSLVKNICMQECTNGGELIANYIPPEGKDKYVSLHNLYRACIANGPSSSFCRDANATDENQPQAPNMREVMWDDYLAYQAQIWADNCEFKHNKAPDSRFSVGQNIAIQNLPNDKYGYLPDYESDVGGWFSEWRNYDFHPLTREDFTERSEDNQIGHYTQLVWADTYLIGCGFAYYKEAQGSTYHKLTVCNYGPSGNYYGERPYKVGTPDCSKYGLVDSSIQGLCTK